VISQANFITQDKAIGKMIASISNPYWRNLLVIKFTDGTFLLYEAYQEDRDSGLELRVKDQGGYQMLPLLGEDAIRLGICTEQEFIDWTAEETRKNIASRENWERNQYEMYRKKFESK
jgi:hypothetical protein